MPVPEFFSKAVKNGILPGTLVLLGMYVLSRFNYLLFHGIAEGFSIVIAFAIFMVAWNTREFHKSSYWTFLGIAYLGVGFVDFMHTVSYKGVSVIPGSGSNYATQFWIAGRLLESGSLAIAPLFFNRKIDAPKAFLSYGVIVTLIIFSILAGIFPDCFIEGKGLTSFKVNAEYLISLTLLFAAFHMIIKKEFLSAEVMRYFLSAIGLTILSELTFTLYSDVYGILNAVGHFLKLASFYLIYRGVIVTGLVNPYSILFKELNDRTEALKESKEKIKAIVRTVGEGIVVIDEDSIIRIVNEELCNIFGYSEAELIGASVSTLMPEPYRKAHFQGIKKYLDAGSGGKAIGKRIEMEGLDKSGRVFPLELRVEKSGNSLGKQLYTGAVRDISERKKRELELEKAREEAELANELKDRFVTLVSHDLKGPLSLVHGFLGFLKDENLSEHESKMVKASLSSIKNMNELIKDLLNLSKIKGGRIIPELETVPARFFSVKAIEEFGPMAEKKGVKFVDKISEEEVLNVDRALFLEVVRNLASNAVKFTKTGGTVTIFIPPADKGSFAISDDGVGIEKDRIELLFSYEEKTNTVGTDDERGSGLGLPLCNDIIEAHNGKLLIETEEERGSSFYIALPPLSNGDNR